LSTKLSLEDYNAFRRLTKLEYQARLIKEGTLELLRFTICHILNRVSNDQIHRFIEQQQEKA
jgi:hypothetical protein